MATRAQAHPSSIVERTSWFALHRAGQARVSWLVEAVLVVALLVIAWQTVTLARNHEATLASEDRLMTQQAATHAQLEQIKTALAPTAFTIIYDEQTGQGIQVTAAAPAPARPLPAAPAYVIAYDEQTGQGVQVRTAPVATTPAYSVTYDDQTGQGIRVTTATP